VAVSPASDRKDIALKDELKSSVARGIVDGLEVDTFRNERCFSHVILPSSVRALHGRHRPWRGSIAA